MAWDADGYQHDPLLSISDHAVAMGMALSIPGSCQYCSTAFSVVMHSGKCPRVTAIEYYPDGLIRRVEFRDE